MKSTTNGKSLARYAKFFGALGAAKAYAIAQVARSYRPVAVICGARQRAAEVFEDLVFFCGPERVRSFPAWESLPLEMVSPPLHVSAERNATLHALATNRAEIVVASISGLTQRVLPQGCLRKFTFSLARNDKIEREELLGSLLDSGFRRVTAVEDIGEFAVRGGIVDLYPVGPNPVRLEFDHERISDIRYFDPDSQRSTQPAASVLVTPAREFVPLREGAGVAPFAEDWDAALERIRNRATLLGVPTRDTNSLLESMQSGTEYPGLEIINLSSLRERTSFFDYLPADTLLVLVDEPEISRIAASELDAAREREERLRSDHYFTPAFEDVFIDVTELEARLGSRNRKWIDQVELQSKKSDAKNLRAKSTADLGTRMLARSGSGSAFKPLRDQISKWRDDGYDIACVVGSPVRAERLKAILLDLEIEAPVLETTGNHWLHSPRRTPVAIVVGYLAAGAVLPSEKVVFLAESEIFRERSRRSRARVLKSTKRILSALSLLKEGAFVVHVDFGIGIYQGLQHRRVAEAEGDFLVIDYADSRLYLPVQHIGKIQKFIGGEGQEPTVDKLSSKRWAREKKKIRESVVSLAGDLIKLYASRNVTKGWRFEPYGAEDERFADSFPYDETIDQSKAIQGTVEDMSKDKPMDRLICGDVGFGKTEVAIRAAFKCVQHARQVALLAPTTILVEQHRANFEARFAEYPVKIASISRLNSSVENKRTLERLASGELDIIIGTHRLLQADVHFKDLGLLVIDEEHRFGVKQKERLKSLRPHVDVLTLTATPIPRTLHMSLLGLRDISVISTPPTDRRAVQTYVIERGDSAIRDAIVRELARGGQCFFLHNRVQNIEVVTSHLKHLVPEARFDYIHGKMNEHHTERIMRRFVNKEVDVLVSTTIIESGIDVPNANTMLIDRADALGLAQLYQLRGRVGRSDRQAFAYFLIPSLRHMNPDAQARLKVLQSLDELGVGFNLALRDLEIRGAGNLLGKEQSGNVTAVGFELYCKILEEAILNLKGEEVPIEEVVDPEVKLHGVDAYLPEPYIPDVAERLLMYQRLAAIRTGSEADQLRDELIDRFGDLSEEGENLVEMMRIRGLLRRFGVLKADLYEHKFVLTFAPQAVGWGRKALISGEAIVNLAQQNPQQFTVTKNHSLTQVRPNPSLAPPRAYSDLQRLFDLILQPSSVDAVQAQRGVLS